MDPQLKLAEAAIAGHEWSTAIEALHRFSSARMHDRYASKDDDDSIHELLHFKLVHSMTEQELVVYGLGR